ncbi:conserved Plasmodium protein, unknown function [Plasmodium knowlesi strain H]|uniref:Clp1 P-loop domain-containing protein n=3 Tax=Plasmodium knowlesi TaxID=5850 RepID=A0A5K1VS50_PLAKH|nr:CLP1 P-loop domain-containing protein, putative [Plasmodium knowlesi strain H]OTN65859.1 Uncharacterized protein PKNOH_S100068900 [Plasmodium knowlesi]CAA9988038.1 CLP1 P-loop domain-containing protein, putative [Plasmodium knowlesi strain H]SBO21974.1 conserved Plasmodium protein, unknown function [Plasmodium knowlesi strain H]SBO29493.1 conserved Plasmodium protein, unknown function [Plasmodium knowlesi strain H]VVS77512.1 CLP1 P-loop domain-containing protein, putative [Plasmodium knowle|eukprot:XP_002259017.1 hypothetical protein, conserved in Plasmodium species [Plasmodium knowlesi strain H]
MCGCKDDLKCLMHFEYNLIESYDTVKKIREDHEYTLVHTKRSDEERRKKKIYLLGLNYDECIFLRGNFRFRLLKGIGKFNGQVMKPSERYTNVRIPDFYPLFKFVALNGSNVKYDDNRFVFSARSCYLGCCDCFDCCEREEVKVIDTEITQRRKDITDSKDNKEPDGESTTCAPKCGKNLCLNECSNKILQNYLYGLNILKRDNGKRKEFYEYVVNADKHDVSTLASVHMMDTISRKDFWEKYPIVIAFEKKKDFLYNLANRNCGKKVNLSNCEKNNNPYIDTYQVSYVLREFMRYIQIGKKYHMRDILARAGGDGKSHYRIGNEGNDKQDDFRDDKRGDHLSISHEGEDKVVEEEVCELQEELERNPNANEYEQEIRELPEFVRSTKYECWELYKRNRINSRIHQFDYPYYKRERDTSNIFSIMVMGDKGKGKSLLTMNLVNNLLNFFEEVYLVDIDVGQPIIGISGFLSIYKIKCPLNNYNFFQKKSKCIKKIFFGGCSIEENIPYYIECLEYLYFYLFYIYFEKKKKRRRVSHRMNEYCYPVVINTFGWVRNIGLLLLNLNIHLSYCNFIVQIDSLKCDEKVKSKLNREELVSYLFNDFLLIKLGRRNDMYTILNLNNENVSVISEPHSLFNVISEYSNLKENNFLFHKFDMSFEREKIINNKTYHDRSDTNFKERECEAHMRDINKVNVNTCPQGSCDFKGNGHPRYSNKEVPDIEKQKRIENQSGIKNYDISFGSEEKYDYLKKKMKFFFGWNCVRVINFVSYEKILSHDNMHGLLKKSEDCSIQARRLRWFRIFSYFFYKFNKIIFYSYSPSFGDALRDRYGHSRCNSHRTSSAGEMKEQATLHQEGDPRGDNGTAMDKGFLTGKELSTNDNPLEGVCHDKIKYTVSECEVGQTNLTTKECSTQIYKPPQSNGPLFNCAIFNLKNIKLSSLVFNRYYFNLFPHGYFNASRFFFNNVICLCKDVNVASSASRSKRKWGGNHGELMGSYEMGERREDDVEGNRVDYYIDRLYINANFKNANSFIKEEYFRENNVQLVPLRENFTCLLTAYVKLIDNFRLIIYLPFWFREFDLLSSVDTFVVGTQLAPRYMDDMINEYLFYYDVITEKGDEMMDGNQMGNPTEVGPAC